MSKMVKRIAAAVLALIMALSVAACGGGESTNNGGNVNSTNGDSTNLIDGAFDSKAFVESMPAELKGTTIKFLNWYDPYDFGQEGEVIDAFEKASEIDVEIIEAAYGPEYREKLAGLIATGDSPDVYSMDKPSTAYMKSLQPITNTGYDFSDSAWNKLVKDTFSVGGVQYAANLKYTPFARFLVINYNTSVMEDMGFEDPYELYKKGEWTWEKLKEMAKEWVKQGTDYYGVGTSIYTGFAATTGQDFVSYDGSKWNMNLYDQELLQTWQFVLEGRANQLFTQGANVVFDAARPKALFNISNTSGLEAKSTWNQKVKKFGYFASVPMPKFEGKDYYVPINELISFGVPIGAKNAKAVPYFIAWYGNLANYDIDTFYFDERSRDIQLELLGAEKQFLSMSDSIFSFEANPFTWHLFNNGTASQITTFIQSMENQAIAKLDELNGVLANMSKQ